MSENIYQTEYKIGDKIIFDYNTYYNHDVHKVQLIGTITGITINDWGWEVEKC